MYAPPPSLTLTPSLEQNIRGKVQVSCLVMPAAILHNGRKGHLILGTFIVSVVINCMDR